MKSEMKILSDKVRSALCHGYGVPIAVSLLIHAVMFGLLMSSWSKPSDIKKTPPLHIKASLVEVAKPAPPAKKVEDRSREIEEKKRKAREAAKRKEEQALARKKEAERKKQIALKKEREAKEKARIAEQKRKEQERQKQLEARRKTEQEELKKTLQREQMQREQEQKAAAQAEKDASEVAYYSALLVNRMSEYWNRPPSARNNMVAVVEMRLSPFGDLQGFKILESSGNEAFDRSVVQAIKLGTPVAELKKLDRRIFEQYFRRFTFKFSPGDLVR